ncbi:MAG: WD40 repeat domain-containing protein [Acidobacteriota bacterium]
MNDDTINTIDLSSNTVYGPFLGGSLGSGELLDVAVTPDGHYALVSNFDAQTVYRVDLTNPASPVLAGSVSVPIEAEDIAISPDGTFAMVTDGGDYNQICVINLSTFTLQTTYTVPGSTYITAIAIAPDNQTWVAADYESGLIFYGTYSLGGGFILTGSLSTPSPLNVTISPDGQTALVANVDYASVSAFSITGPGTLAAGNTVGGLPASPQSIAFSPGGATAYVDSVSCPDAISWLTVTAPGMISLGAAGAASLTGFCGTTYFGVDGLAVTPDGQRLVVGNTGESSAVDLVDTSAFGVTNLATPGSYPVGVATFMAFSGTVTNPYNLSFQDDYGRSDLCVNTTTGAWQWTVLKGNGAGKIYSGAGTIISGTGFLRLTAAPGSGYGMTLIDYTTAHRATATFAYPAGGVGSGLYDINTLNDGPCGGGD